MGKMGRQRSTHLSYSVQPYDQSTANICEKTTRVAAFRERLGRLKKDKKSTIDRLTQMAFDLTQSGYEEDVVDSIEAHIMTARPEYTIPALRLIDRLLQSEEGSISFQELLGTKLPAIYARAVKLPMPASRKREIYRIRGSWRKVFTQPFLEMLDAAAHLSQNVGSHLKRTREESDGEDEDGDDSDADHSRNPSHLHKLQATEKNRFSTHQFTDRTLTFPLEDSSAMAHYVYSNTQSPQCLEEDHETAYWQGEAPDETAQLPPDDGNWGDTAEEVETESVRDNEAHFTERTMLATVTDLSATRTDRENGGLNEVAVLSNANLAEELSVVRMQLMDRMMKEDLSQERERKLLEMVSVLQKEKEKATTQHGKTLADLEVSNRRLFKIESEKNEAERLLLISKDSARHFEMKFVHVISLLECQISKTARLEFLLRGTAHPKELMEGSVEDQPAEWNHHVRRAMRDLEMSEETEDMMPEPEHLSSFPGRKKGHSFAQRFIVEESAIQTHSKEIPYSRA